mgnify:CR=1 FL=1
MASSFLNQVLESAASRYGIISYFKSDRVIGSSLKEYGEWAQKEIDLLARIIEPGDIVLDIGAFIGTHTLAFSNMVGENGWVLAFEPNPLAYEVLNLNVSQNSLTNVKLFNAAVGGEEKEIQVGRLPNQYLQNPGSAPLTAILPPAETRTAKIIRSICLDSLVVDRCKLIKCDVEGMEGAVLSGARQFIHAHRPIVVCECLSLQNGTELLGLMNELRYEGFIHLVSAFNSQNFKGNAIDIFDGGMETNLVFVPVETAGAFQLLIPEDSGFFHFSTIDELALALLKKPQYKAMLTQTNAASHLGEKFWIDESEVTALQDQVHRLESQMQALHGQNQELRQQLVNLQAEDQQKDRLIHHLQPLEGVNQSLQEQLGKLQKQFVSSKSRIKTQKQELVRLQTCLSEAKAQISKLQTLESEYQSQINALETYKNEREQVLQYLNSKLLEIYSSTAWKLIRFMWRFRLWVAPPGSAREKAGRSIVRLFSLLTKRNKVKRDSHTQSAPPAWTDSQPAQSIPSASDASSSLWNDTTFDPNPTRVPDNVLGERQLIKLLDQSVISDSFVLSVSHDNYAESIGGVQLKIQDEQLAYNQQRTSYLHIYPFNVQRFLLFDRDRFYIGLNLDGNSLGFTTGDILLKVLNNKFKEKIKRTILHHLMGFNASFIMDLLRFVDYKACVWIHDSFSICPSYNLLRNNREYCGAPSIDSNSCMICGYSEMRRKQIAFFRELFSHPHLEILTPSGFTTEFWKTKTGNTALNVRTIPHLLFHPIDKNSHRPLNNPLRIGYAGFPVNHKGWQVWLRLVERFHTDRRYQFFVFSSTPVPNDKYTQIDVTNSKNNRLAMLHALRDHKIDVLILWSLCPETFSFVMHEGMAAGCYILTNPDSGNIQTLVKRQACGSVLPDEAELHHLFEGEILTELVQEYQKDGIPQFELVDNTSNLIE